MTQANIVCTMCARGGSKGVPGKNVRPLAGKPLLAHTVEQARATGRFATLAVSSDDDAILDCAKQYGVDVVVRRPATMATDEAAKSPAILHCVQVVEAQTGLTYETMVDLDVTSPLRSTDDIHAVLDLLLAGGCDNVISVTPSRKSPYFNLVELDQDGFGCLSKSLEQPVVRRQDAPPCYEINGSVYAWTREAFFAGPAALSKQTKLYSMPDERSVDIDSQTDWLVVEALMQQRTAAS